MNEWYENRPVQQYEKWIIEWNENRTIQTSKVEIGVKTRPPSVSIRNPLFINSFLESETLLFFIPKAFSIAAGEKKTYPL